MVYTLDGRRYNPPAPEGEPVSARGAQRRHNPRDWEGLPR